MHSKYFLLGLAVISLIALVTADGDEIETVTDATKLPIDNPLPAPVDNPVDEANLPVDTSVVQEELPAQVLPVELPEQTPETAKTPENPTKSEEKDGFVNFFEVLKNFFTHGMEHETLSENENKVAVEESEGGAENITPGNNSTLETQKKSRRVKADKNITEAAELGENGVEPQVVEVA